MNTKEELYRETDLDFSNNSNNESFEEVWTRRRFIQGSTLSAGALLIESSALAASDNKSCHKPHRLSFTPLETSTGDKITVPTGYKSKVILRWGDPIVPGTPSFNPTRQTAETQAGQFGYNCDFVGFIPNRKGLFHNPNRRTLRGLLIVNHEYTDPTMMFHDYVPANPTNEQVNIELAAHGVSVVQLEYKGHKGWAPVRSRYNRRITGETECIVTGPAAGHELLKTSADLTGLVVNGTLNNCAGGKTPWGTILTCEENFNQYFANNDKLPTTDPRKAIHQRYGLPGGATERLWEKFHDRFDVSKEPNEPFRFGWVVEIDPFKPHEAPKKRTALGRFKHEAATVAISAEGYAVIYTGDDERFEYMYKFVSDKQYNDCDREANMDLLDSGALYVAKFNDDGTGIWIALKAGEGVLSNWTQAEICINTRIAAGLVGATKMDRPEDIEMNRVNGKVYGVFTNNTRRGTGTNPPTDKANPRSPNKHGHIIEVNEANDDPASSTFTWEMFILCGDPKVPTDGTYFAGWTGDNVPAISAPDNIAFDSRGNLWIATDGQPGTLGINDAIYAVPVEGPERGYLRRFMSAPIAAEVCGPEFTPDNKTLFCAIQHPGEGGTLSNPVSTWPDGNAMPRPSVVAVQNNSDNKEIGS